MLFVIKRYKYKLSFHQVYGSKVRNLSLKKMDKYEFVKDIGVGSFGLAKLMRNKETKELVAVKLIERGPKVNENVAREIINHRTLMHPNVVRFKEVLLTPAHLVIVMEYAAGGELYDRVINAGRFTEDEARYFFQQLISGVSYCHSMQISHGDLKLANTLLDGTPAPRLKICDFGYSMSSVLHSQPKSITGTLRYIAPEVLSGTEYDGKLADVWSCGVTLYVMLVGAYPFADDKEPENIEKTMQRILGSQYEIPAYINISKECRHLLSRIFVTPAKRIKIQEIKNHPWFLRNLPRELYDAALALYDSKTDTTFPFQSLDGVMQIVAEATLPPLVSDSIGGFRREKEKNNDDQENVELEVGREEIEEEDEFEVAEENGYDKKVKEVYKSEGLSLSGVVRLPERSLVQNQFRSNDTDPSPLAATIVDASMFGLCLAERSHHTHSYHLDSAVSQSVTYAESAKNSIVLDSSMYVRMAERSVESNTSHSYHSNPSASQSVSFARNSELSYPSISNVCCSEKSIMSNVSHPSEYQMQSPDSASELSDTKSWEKVRSFDPSICNVREAEKSIVLEQLHSYQDPSDSTLHDTGLSEGSLDSKVLDTEYSAQIENLDLSISDVRSAEKSVVSNSHFNWRGWMGKGRAK